MSKKYIFLCLVSGLAACGSDSKEMTVGEFTQKISENECTSVAAACGITLADCLSTRLVYWAGVANAATAVGRPFDPSLADACLSKVKSNYSVLDNMAVISANDYLDGKKKCDRVFHGPAKENQACGATLDCTKNLVCDKGFCGHPAEVGAGKQCANIGEYCAQGYTCAVIGTGPVRQCVARADRGAVCTSDDTCLETLRCSGGLCIDRLDVSSVCQQDTDCAKGFCNPFTHKCGLNIGMTDGSAACDAFRPIASAIPTGGADASVFAIPAGGADASVD